MQKSDEFNEFREKMHRIILDSGNVNVKRFFALDGDTYRDGALDAQTKELLGLVASMVLRCDDCIRYHLEKTVTGGATRKELFDVFSVALMVGGSIVIPHLRRAVAALEELLPRED